MILAGKASSFRIAPSPQACFTAPLRCIGIRPRDGGLFHSARLFVRKTLISFGLARSIQDKVAPALDQVVEDAIPTPGHTMQRESAATDFRQGTRI